MPVPKKRSSGLTASVTRLRPCVTCSVREMSVCGALQRDELHRLAAIVSQVEFEGRATIFYEGEPAEHFYIVTGGAVGVYKLLADGRRQITGFLYPGDLLGIEYYGQYVYSAEAINSVQLCKFTRGELEMLCGEFPKFEERLLWNTSNELAVAQDHMLLLGQKSTRERLATFILGLAERAARRGELPDVVNLPMSRGDIGDYLGMSLETASRTFTLLSRMGVIAYANPKKIVLVDPLGLRQIAGVDDDANLPAETATFSAAV